MTSESIPTLSSGDEDLVLLLFFLIPALLFFILYRYWKQFRSSKQSAGKWLVIFANGLATVGLLGIILLGAEVYYRFFYDTTDSLNCTKVSERWFARYFHANSSGWRDTLDYKLNISGNKAHRVTFVGDSFTAGHGVTEVSNVFAMLVRQAHPEWEIHMLARPGFDTQNEMELLQNATTQGYQLDLVILVYCLNDITDLNPDGLEAIQKVNQDLDNSGWLRRNSFFLNTAIPKLKLIGNPYFKNYFSILKQTYSGPLWETQKARLSAIHDIVRTNGGSLAVITFPFLNKLGPSYEFESIHQQLETFWKEESVPTLDLLPLFRPLSPSLVTVNRLDAHPNEKAHRLAFDRIEKFITEQITTRKTIPTNK